MSSFGRESPNALILVVAANPLDTDRLAVDEEVKRIEKSVRQSRYRDRIWVRSLLAPTFDDLQQALLEDLPAVVHFCGHGTDTGLVLQDELQRARQVSREVLTALFRLAREHVRCVVLSACYSAPQAEAIAEHVDYVVGIEGRLDEDSAYAMAVAFYNALGVNRSIEDAFEHGLLAYRSSDQVGDALPVLHTRPGAPSWRLLEEFGLDGAGPVGERSSGEGSEDSNLAEPPLPLRFGPALQLGIAVLGIVLILVAWRFAFGGEVAPDSPTLYALRVQVLDPHGQPVEGSSLRVSAGNEPHLLPDGWWQVEIPATKIPTNGEVRVWAEHPHWASSNATVGLAEDPNPRVEVRLGVPEERIRGVVVDATGRGVEGVRVTARSFAGSAAVTDRDGGFVLTVQAAPDRRVRLHAEHAELGANDSFCYAGGEACVVTLRSP
ncbi:MAG: CHAT domain-containing protein [Holophagales bacterium]|nr:CHAT domain-containing protein [Holophagales bacterium]